MLLTIFLQKSSITDVWDRPKQASGGDLEKKT